MRGVIRVLLTLALAGMCTGYFLAEKRVTLSDEGRTKTVKTFAPTVGAALVRLGVSVGKDDRVLPSPDSNLAAKIEVRRAKHVVVVVDGNRRRESVTGRTVSEVLRELDVPTTGAYLEPAAHTLVARDAEIVVATPAQVTVEHDGVSRPVTTNALTAGALLRELGIALGPHDRVEPSIVASPGASGVIKVIRVREAIETRQTPIPFARVVEKSDKLELGLRKLKTPGAEGVRSKSYRVVYQDGRVKSRTFVSSSIVRPPQNEVTLVGTKRPEAVLTGNLQTGKASWYSAPALTAAHRTLPMGTNVKVTNVSNGKTVTVVIRDRGPFISGRIIDLSQAAFNELASTSSGVISVKIEW